MIKKVWEAIEDAMEGGYTAEKLAKAVVDEVIIPMLEGEK
jgi:hypothetical protein